MGAVRPLPDVAHRPRRCLVRVVALARLWQLGSDMRHCESPLRSCRLELQMARTAVGRAQQHHIMAGITQGVSVASAPMCFPEVSPVASRTYDRGAELNSFVAAREQAGGGGGRARRVVLQRRDLGPDHHGALHAALRVTAAAHADECRLLDVAMCIRRLSQLPPRHPVRATCVADCQLLRTATMLGWSPAAS